MTFARKLTLLFTALVTSLVMAGTVSAAPALAISVIAPESAPAGTDAALTVRVEGESPDLASLDFHAEGAGITGLVSLNLVAPGVAEGTVHLRRETPGEAVLRVMQSGTEVASGTVRFAAEGRIRARVTLDADAHASARTWSFEVVDPAGAIVATLFAGTNGYAPTGEALTAPLPYGLYTVRQVLGNDTATACVVGKFYRTVAEATVLELAASESVAHFRIEPCADAPVSLSVSIPVDTITPAQPVDEVRGARAEGTPLPPATGTGTLRQSGSDGAWPLLLALIPLLPAVLLGRRCFQRSQA